MVNISFFATSNSGICIDLCVVGEYDPAYTAVGNSTAIPTWPVTSPTRWNILLEAIILPDHAIMPTTQVSNAPSNRAVALLDSGTSYTLVLASDWAILELTNHQVCTTGRLQ